MKSCASCGTQVPDDAAFCNNCGSPLVNKDTATGAPAAAPAADASAQASQPTPQPAPQPAPGFQGGQQQYGQAPSQYQPYPKYDPSDHTAEFDPRDIADNKLFAVIPYLIGLLAGLVAGIYIKDSAFYKFHFKNALRLEIATLLALIPAIIPFLGWFVSGILIAIILVIEIIAIVQVFQGKAKDLPIVGSIGFLK